MRINSEGLPQRLRNSLKVSTREMEHPIYMAIGPVG